MIRSKPKPELKEHADGRIELRGRLYQQMKQELFRLAGGRCEICGRWTADGDAHHVNGRGGGRRDDRIMVNGKRNLLYVCRQCHQGKHVPSKVIPPKMSDQEFKQMLGLGEE